ncbi:MAG TPA: hypothetical protein VJZ91_19725 [Blastocatellia bacterium]|nr:hypothetical protein [Blastocatellia bacterium]
MSAYDAITRTSDLPNIDEVSPLSEKDAECLSEIKQVLDKYGFLQRFGVCLLHEHFTLADDEVMVESCDEETRTLTSRPVKASEIMGHSIGTMWRLDINANISRCIQYCELEDGPNGKMHLRKHKATIGWE